VPDALKGFSAPNAGAPGAAAPPNTNGCPAGAAVSDGAAGAPPNEKTPPLGCGAAVEAAKLKEGVAANVGTAAGAVEAAPNAGAAVPKTEPEPKAGVEEVPNVGAEAKEGAEDKGAPKEGKAGAAAGAAAASGFGTALNEKIPLFASAAGLLASDEPKLKTGALDMLNPPAAGAEASSGFNAPAKAKLGPPDFFAADSPESSSFVLFIPSVAAGLTALAAKIDGVGVELLAAPPKENSAG